MSTVPDFLAEGKRIGCGNCGDLHPKRLEIVSIIEGSSNVVIAVVCGKCGWSNNLGFTIRVNGIVDLGGITIFDGDDE